jgi:REP element-mobilizing transposase RayT
VFVLQVGLGHVHVFVGLRSSCSIFVLIGLLKCNSVRRLFLAFLELKGKRWRGYLWSRGKFYCLIGQVSGEMIKRYIEQSKYQH